MSKQPGAITFKEMHEQPASFEAIGATLPQIREVLKKAFENPYDLLIFTGCGTSYYLAQSAAFAWNQMTDTLALAVPCSELYFFPEAYAKGRRTLVIPITRKSYTTEVRMAIDRVRALSHVRTLAITCDPDSEKYNDYVILSPDTAEDSVIMTRSFTSMVHLSVTMALLVAGQEAQVAAMADYHRRAEALLPKMDALTRQVLRQHPDINLYVMLGQGAYYGIANECMNKIKEMSLSNSEAYHSLEYRHGPMSLVDERTLVVMLACEETRAYDVKLMEQMKGFGATTVAIGENAVADFAALDYTLDLEPGLSSVRNGAIIGFVGQFLGYYAAQQKGLDCDMPRHLSQAIVLNQ